MGVFEILPAQQTFGGSNAIFRALSPVLFCEEGRIVFWVESAFIYPWLALHSARLPEIWILEQDLSSYTWRSAFEYQASYRVAHIREYKTIFWLWRSALLINRDICLFWSGQSSTLKQSRGRKVKDWWAYISMTSTPKLINSWKINFGTTIVILTCLRRPLEYQASR